MKTSVRGIGLHRASPERLPERASLSPYYLCMPVMKEVLVHPGRAHSSHQASTKSARAVVPTADDNIMTTRNLGPVGMLDLQRSVGNNACVALLATVQRTPSRKKPQDKPIDVVEAVVHMMSNRGLSGDVGAKGENVSSPRYAPEVAKTVLEPEHKALLWAWYLIAVGDDITHGDRGKISDSQAKTDSLIARMNADKSHKSKAALLTARYAAGVEELTQRAARSQVDEMIEAGVAVVGKGTAGKGFASEDDWLRVGVEQARKVLTDVTGLTRKMASSYTTDKLTKAADKRVSELYDEKLRIYLRKVFKEGELADAPELTTVQRASGMNFADGVHLVKGGLDGVSAILAATDPKKREALFRERSNVYGSVAQGAEINAVMWKFVSGAVAFGGAGVYGVAKLAGNTALAEGVLDATVKGVANVSGVLNLAGIVHGAAVLLDPDATANQKAEAAVEVTSSAIGLASFASRWVPRLAWASRWSGPVAASLAINFMIFKRLADLRYKAEVGMKQLDWSTCYRVTDAAAQEVQRTQRQLAVTRAILATETDPRRKTALQGYADAFRYVLLDQNLKPFVEKRLSSTGMDDDPDSCGYALSKRFKPMQASIGSAASSDDAALNAGATFLLIVDKAFSEWDQIVMEKKPKR